MADLLSGAVWQCAAAPATAASTEPLPLPDPPSQEWLPATVPGTVAAALLAAPGRLAAAADLDESDWWYRCRFDAPDDGGPHLLRLDGLATIADVWLNSTHLLHSEDMFISHECEVDDLLPHNELLLRFAALSPRLGQRRPRPRWKSPDLPHQNLRWVRTTLLGRQRGGVRSPAPVGPWRPVRLVRRLALHVVHRQLVAAVAPDGSGIITFSARLSATMADTPVHLVADGHRVQLDTFPDGDGVVVSGRLALPGVRHWWPHTHGGQPLYDVDLVVGDDRVALGRVGFRTVTVDADDGAFTLRCNGTAVFCRGVCWSPPDPVSLVSAPDELRQRLLLLRDAGLNMVRVVGTGVYESAAFFDLCDELGILVWQDCMFAFYDVPDDPEFTELVVREVTGVLTALQGRPSVAVICGGSENEQQAAYLGLAPEAWCSRLAHQVIPDLVDRLLPGTPYVPNSPSGRPLPSVANRGPAHYFGVGAYLAPVEDARRAGVRFASECLAFANPPEPLDTLAGWRELRGMGHHPTWKAAVHRDADSPWDLEDVRDLYTERLFGVDVRLLRRSDPERAGDLARATVATVFEQVLSEWRRAGSPCAGVLVLQAHDTQFGAGPGLVDSLGRPKSPWYVLERLMRPAVVLFTDEGVNGLLVHVACDRTDRWYAALRLDLYVDGEARGGSTTVEVTVTGGGATVDTATAFGGFRDLGYVHRFGPPSHDVVAATLVDADGRELSQAVFLPGQPVRPVEPDLGLTARACHTPELGWHVTVSARRFAQWLTVDVPGWRPHESWVHVLPGSSRVLRLVPAPVDGLPSTEPPAGQVRALNCRHPVRIAPPTS